MGEMRERNASSRERKGSRGGKEESKQSERSGGCESEARAEIIAEALRKTAKGTALAFFGLLLFGILDFASKVLIARHASQAEYGIFSLALSLLQICTILSCLGLQAATPRCIAFFRGRGEFEKARSIVFASLQLALIASVLCGATLFLASPLLTTLFHLPASATQIFQIFAVALPFSVAVEMLASVFRGYDRVQEKVIFRDILSNVLKVLFIVSAIALGYAFLGIICAYLLAIITASLLFFAYTSRKIELKGGRRGERAEEKQKESKEGKGQGAKRAKRERGEWEEEWGTSGGGSGESLKEIRKKLLVFSVPLLIANVSSALSLRMDTFMLGYFKTAEIVGLYNAAQPIAQLIQIFLTSMVFIYVPIASQLYSKNLIGEMRRCYAVLTKWIFSATFPLFLLMFLFPEEVLRIFFGSAYVSAASALRILAIGMLFHVFFGPNASTLIVIGKTKLNMVDNIVGIFVNAVLNVILVPILGIIGAAISTTTSLAAINGLKTAQIFKIHGIHPFTTKYFKPILASCVVASIIYAFITLLDQIDVKVMILLLFLFSLAQIFCLILTRSLEYEDIMIISEIKKMLKRI